MDKRTKIKAAVTILCMAASLFALYTFLFVSDLGPAWKAVLCVVAVFWLISGASNLLAYFSRK